MTHLLKKIKCQLCLALILSSIAATSYAVGTVAPGPICHVTAQVKGFANGKAAIKVITENKISDGFDKAWTCTFRRSPTVTITLSPDDFKKLVAGATISAYLQQGGDQNGLWVAAANIIILNR